MDKVIEIKRRAQRCILNGDLDGAMAEYEKLVASGDRDPYYCVLLADLLFKKGRSAAAEVRYLEAVEGYERQGLYKNAIAVCKKMSRLSIAEIQVAKRLAELHREDGLPTEAGLCFIQHAELLIKKDRLTEARDSLRLACEASPDLVRALERLGEVEVLAGNPAGAVSAWDDAAARHEKAGNAAESKRWRNRAEQLRPSVPGAGRRAGAGAGDPGLDAEVADTTAADGVRHGAGADLTIERGPSSETTVPQTLASSESDRHDADAIEISHGTLPETPSESEAPQLPVAFEMFESEAPGLDEASRSSDAGDAVGGPAARGPFDEAASGTPKKRSSAPASKAATRFPPSPDAAPDGTSGDSTGGSGGAWDFGIPRTSAAPVPFPAMDDDEGAAPEWEVDSAAEAEVNGEPDDAVEDAEPSTADVSANGESPVPTAAVESGFAPRADREPAAPSPRAPSVAPANTGGVAQAEGDEAGLAAVAELLQEAQVHFHKGDRDAASIALIRAAQAYDQMGRYDSAAAIYRSLGHSTDSSLQLMLLWMKNCQRRDDGLEAARVACDLGDRALNDGDRPGAREWFERARAYDPNNEVAARRLRHFESGGAEPHGAPAPAPAVAETGMLNIRTDREEPVIIDLGTLIEEFQRGAGAQLASDPQGNYDLAMSYREMGLFDAAVDSFRVAAHDPAFFLRSTEMIGRCLLEVGQFDEAAQELRAALGAPDLPRDVAHDLRYQLGLALEAAGRTQEALAEFEMVYAAQANYPDVAMKIRVLRKSVGAN